MTKHQLVFQDFIHALREFNKVYKDRCDYEGRPTLRDEDISLLRYKLMREENEEYLEACQKGDLVEIADALGDQLYILCGTIIAHGMQDVIEDVFMEIQRSNMSKLDEEGQPIYREDGKILKGKQYFPPDLKSILDKVKK